LVALDLAAPPPVLNVEIVFSTASLPHSGQRSWRSRLADRISFSNLAPQWAQMYSNIGIVPPKITPRMLGQVGDSFHDDILVGYPRVLLDDLAVSVQDNQGRDAAHAILPGRPTADVAGHTEADHLRLACQVSFDPIHDGLGQQARTSSVAIEFDDGWLATRDQSRELVGRSKLGTPGTEQEKAAEKRRHNAEEQRILA
jgi:hypothetical protein